MEIPRWSYFLFWATIGVVFSRLGFNALDKTELSNAVPPPVLSFFKHSLAISTAYSSIHAFLFSPPRKPINKWILLYAVIIWIVIYYPGRFQFWYFWVFTLYNLSSFFLLICIHRLVSTQEGPDHKTALIAHLAVGSSMLLVGDRKKFLPCAVSSIALLISVPCLAMSENETFHKLMRLVARANTVVLSLKEKSGKLTEFAVGMVGTILFQNFFRLTSFNHVVAFLYFAVGWLANLALLRPSDDLGIFNFLLSNVVVGCTVSQFGLRPTTWLVYGGSILLFGLRLKIQALTLVDNGKDSGRLILHRWNDFADPAEDSLQEMLPAAAQKKENTSFLEEEEREVDTINVQVLGEFYSRGKISRAGGGYWE